ncbi:cell division protein ZapE [Maricaulaceae bacterium EIL42A08]|nr:cell division protein ZapE [Maricaulaceae bacterium EIL42A08]
MTPNEALQGGIDEGRLQPDAAQARAADLLTHLWKNLEQWKGGKRGLFGRRERSPVGVYLYGGVGTGKSLMMDLFFETAPVEHKRRVHFHQFLQEVQTRITEERAKKDRDPLPRVAQAIAREARLLCFDELQVTDVGDAMILGRLFEGLFAEGVVMVATSNRHPDELYKNGLNRQLFEPFIDMIKARMSLYELDSGRDYRLERLEAGPVYYTPLGADADAAMNAAFERLTMGAKARTTSITVKGRVLDVTREAAGVARFEFEELCARPLGPADYLALAERFHTILIDHTPLLTPDKRDQAKRFGTLIDALYEVKTKLVMSAAAEPDSLYTDGDYAFEFQRTASRLMEMRSHDYLAAERKDAIASSPAQMSSADRPL